MTAVLRGLSILLISTGILGTAVAEGEEAAAQGWTDAVELGEVAVTATRREVPLSDVPEVTQVITRSEIEALNPASTGDLLEQVTGTSVETGTGSGLPNRRIVGLNGLPASYTLVLVDGVRLLSEHIHTGRNLDLIPPGFIERIEIIRGAASAQYGADAIGGVINIVTRKCRDETETTLSGSAGMYETFAGGITWLRPVSEKVRISMFLEREQSDGVPLLEPAHRVDNMGYKQLNLLARIEVDLAEPSRLFGWVNWVDSAVDWRGDEADSDLVTGVVGLSQTLLPDLSLFALFFYSQWDAETSSEKNELLTPEAYLTWKVHDSHTLTGGIDYKDHTFTRSAVREADQGTVGAFLQYELRFADTLTLMTALRFDDVDDVDAVLSPKASLLFSPEWSQVCPIRLRASVARGFHAPTPQELHEEGYGHGGRAYRFGNPDLEPEYSTTVGLGVDLFPGRPLEVMLYGHFSDIDDMIVPVYEGPWEDAPEGETIDVWRRTNVDHARVWGGGSEGAVHRLSGPPDRGGVQLHRQRRSGLGPKAPLRPRLGPIRQGGGRPEPPPGPASLRLRRPPGGLRSERLELEARHRGGRGRSHGADHRARRLPKARRRHHPLLEGDLRSLPERLQPPRRGHGEPGRPVHRPRRRAGGEGRLPLRLVRGDGG